MLCANFRLIGRVRYPHQICLITLLERPNVIKVDYTESR